MRNNIQLEVPVRENPFFDMAILGDTEREIGDKLARDGFCVTDFPLDDIEILADTLARKMEKHFLEETINGKIHPGKLLQDAKAIEEVKFLSISSSNLAENVCG